MANLNNPTKRKLETLFGMGGGYVLDFTNATFRDFVVTAIGVDPYVGGYDSKANLLRRMWQELPDATIAKLNLELIDYWKDGKLIADESIGEAEQRMHDSSALSLVQPGNPASRLTPRSWTRISARSTSPNSRARSRQPMLYRRGWPRLTGR